MASTRRRFLGLASRALILLLGAPALVRAQERARAIHAATRNTLTGAIGVRLRRLFQGRPERAHAHEGRPRQALPAPAREPALPLAEALARYAPAAGFAAAALPRAALARLLHFTNGVTGSGPGGVALRAAPSAGALYAGEVYVVAARVEGLEAGVYAFLPLEEGRLARLEGTDHPLARVAEALVEPARARGAACAVLLTNVFARYRYRYANRGYRYALLDSGHLGENLRLAATSAGLAEWGPLDFRDAPLNALLGVDGVEEAVCAVHLLGARGEAPPADAARHALEEAARAGRSPPAAVDDAPERYHAATVLVRSDAGAPEEASAAEAGKNDGDEAEEAPPAKDAPSPEGTDGSEQASPTRGAGELRALPAPASPSVVVEKAIETRRSARRFRVVPLAAEDLAFVVRAAAGPPALERAPGVELRLFVHRVEGVAAGLYRVRRDGRALEPLREEALDEALVDACLGQEKAGRAAVGFAMVGALTEAAARGGDRTYRDLCLEAGGIGQRIYLAAESAGLAARNLAAFVDDELNELAGVDGRDRAVLHLTMLGAGD